MGWLRDGLLFLVVGVIALAAERADTATDQLITLDHARAVGPLSVARDGLGRVGVWDKETGWVRVWKPDGSLATQCRVTDLRVGNFPSQLAIRGSRALLKLNDPAPGDNKKQRALVVDLESCEVLHDFVIGGVALSIEPSDSGWLLVVNDTLLVADRYKLIEIDDEGRAVRTFEYDRPARQLVREMKLDDLSGPMNGRLVAVRQEVWFIPNAKYELWRLPQRGLPLRRAEVPECLAAKGRRITGDENVRLYQEMLKDVPEDARKFWMKGKMRDSFWPAATSAAAYERLLAVAVTDGKLGGDERLDIWDLTTESLVAIAKVPAGTWLVSLGPDHAWLLRGAKTFERLALPDLTVPLDDPCKTYAALVESLGEKTTSKPPTPGDTESGTGARTQPTPTAAPHLPTHDHMTPFGP